MAVLEGFPQTYEAGAPILCAIIGYELQMLIVVYMLTVRSCWTLYSKKTFIQTFQKTRNEMAKGYFPSVEVTDAQYEMLNRLLMELCDLLRVLMVTRGSELSTGELRWPCYLCNKSHLLNVHDNPKLIGRVKRWIDQLVYILRSIWRVSWWRRWLLISPDGWPMSGDDGFRGVASWMAKNVRRSVFSVFASRDCRRWPQGFSCFLFVKKSLFFLAVRCYFDIILILTFLYLSCVFFYLSKL